MYRWNLIAHSGWRWVVLIDALSGRKRADRCHLGAGPGQIAGADSNRALDIKQRLDSNGVHPTLAFVRWLELAMDRLRRLAAPLGARHQGDPYVP